MPGETWTGLGMECLACEQFDVLNTGNGCPEHLGLETDSPRVKLYKKALYRGDNLDMLSLGGERKNTNAWWWITGKYETGWEGIGQAVLFQGSGS